MNLTITGKVALNLTSYNVFKKMSVREPSTQPAITFKKFEHSTSIAVKNVLEYEYCKICTRVVLECEYLIEYFISEIHCCML